MLYYFIVRYYNNKKKTSRSADVLYNVLRLHGSLVGDIPRSSQEVWGRLFGSKHKATEHNQKIIPGICLPIYFELPDTRRVVYIFNCFYRLLLLLFFPALIENNVKQN